MSSRNIRSYRFKAFRLTRFLLVLGLVAASISCAPHPTLVSSVEMEQSAASRPVISPEASDLLLRAEEGERVDLELHLRPAPPAPSGLPPASATFRTLGEGGAVSYSLDGRRVGGEELRAHAKTTRAHLVKQAAARNRFERERLERFVQKAGLGDKIRARSGRVVRASLGSRDVERLLTLFPKMIALVDIPRKVETALTDATTTNNQGALETIRVIPFAHGYNLAGKGIGVWLQEGTAPDDADPDIDAKRLRRLTTVEPIDPGHPTLTTITLQKTAPEAVVYYGHQPIGCHILDSIFEQKDPPIYLGSHSWNWTDTGSDVYWSCCAEWDDLVYHSRIPMFVPSGGGDAEHYTTSPGKAFNVVAVGGSDADAGVIGAYSGWQDPETGAIKPDVVAPGTCIAIRPGDACVSGVSISTPIAAGFAADMMSGGPFFLNQPQAVKAYLAAGATTDVEPDIDRDGPGQLDFLNTYFHRWGKWWNGPNSAFFDANDEIVESIPLVAGKRYRIAISWLVSGWYALTYKRPNMEMTLRVTGGKHTYISDHPGSVFEWVDFTALQSGLYTIRIQRTFNGKTVSRFFFPGDLALALTVGEVK